MSQEFNLYSSEGCHLCEQALALITPLISDEQLMVVDIVEDEQLVALYGVHIPVLERLTDNEKLFWPFSANQVANLI